MEVIKKLAERVEKEHNQFLRDSQRLEDRSGIASNAETGSTATTSNVDFASLVGNANGATVKADTVIDSNASWDDDVWGSIFNTNSVCPPFFSNDLPSQFNSIHRLQHHNIYPRLRFNDHRRIQRISCLLQLEILLRSRPYHPP